MILDILNCNNIKSINIKMRRNSYSGLLLLMLVFGASCQLGLLVFSPYPTSVAKCLAQKGYSVVSYITANTLKGLDYETAINAITNMRNGGLNADIILQPCLVRSPVEEARDLIARIPKDLYRKVWLVSGSLSDDEACNWSGTGYCDKFSAFLAQFRKNNINVGVVMSQDDLESQFGECKALSSYDLYWDTQGQDTSKSFDSFVPFGGWSKPAKKICNYFEESACGIVSSLTYEK